MRVQDSLTTSNGPSFPLPSWPRLGSEPPSAGSVNPAGDDVLDQREYVREMHIALLAGDAG